MALERISANRNLILGENVRQESVKTLIGNINAINTDDDLKQNEFNGFVREPINLIVNTYGGSIYDGLALMSAIELSKTPVHITCLGSAMSMGLPIVLSGHKRFAHRYSTFMYHQLSNAVWDKLEDVKQEVKEMERLEQLVDDIILKKTKITREQISKTKETRGEWYITSTEALELGIIDEIL